MKKSILSLTIHTLLIVVLTSCTAKTQRETIWIYTSLFKDTVADIQPKLEAAFPGVEFKFYQAGSEEVAAKVQAESLAGQIQADILISSDRFWYEDLGRQGKLQPYAPINSDKVPESF